MNSYKIKTREKATFEILFICLYDDKMSHVLVTDGC